MIITMVITEIRSITMTIELNLHLFHFFCLPKLLSRQAWKVILREHLTHSRRDSSASKAGKIVGSFLRAFARDSRSTYG